MTLRPLAYYHKRRASRRFQLRVIAAALLYAAAIAAPSTAAVISLSASLQGFTARPPVIGLGGSGSAAASVDDTTGAFSISGMSSGLRPGADVSLRGPNNPPLDVTGPLIFDVPFTTAHQSLGDGFDTSFSGSTTLSSAQVADLLAGEYFVAVHMALPGLDGPDLGGALTVPEPCAVIALCLLPLAMANRRAGRARARARGLRA